MLFIINENYKTKYCVLILTNAYHVQNIDKFLNSFERDNNTIESAQEFDNIMYYDLRCTI